MRNKICYICKKDKPESEYYHSKRDGIQSRCKECCKNAIKLVSKPEHREKERMRKRKTPLTKEQLKIRRDNNLEAYRRYRRDYYRRNRDIQAAHSIVHYAIATGKLLPASDCACGAFGEDIKYEYHHPDYSQPLLVVSMCVRCHKELHKTLFDQKSQ